MFFQVTVTLTFDHQKSYQFIHESKGPILMIQAHGVKCMEQVRLGSVQIHFC